jgi:hypothetical protein
MRADGRHHNPLREVFAIYSQAVAGRGVPLQRNGYPHNVQDLIEVNS